MYRIVLNGETLDAENGCETWRELLDRVDTRCAAVGHIVTEVRFDGVDEPAFRDDRVVERPLDDLATIEIEAITPRDLLLATLDDAHGAAETLGDAAERIGIAFRGFEVSGAAQELGELARSLATLVTITANVAQALGTDLAGLDCGGSSGAELVSGLMSSADSLIGAQEAGDWVTVADIVEYDLAPCLRRWPVLLNGLRAAVPTVVA